MRESDTPLTPLEPWIAAKIGLEAGTPFDRASLEAYQLHRLNETIRLARAHSPFYREHLAGTPDVLPSLADLTALPFTTADHLRAHPQRLLCVSQGDISRVVTLSTTGTTGEPKRIYFTTADQELTRDFFAVGMSTFTDPGDRVLILLPGDLPGSIGDLLADSLGRIAATGVKHGPVRDLDMTLLALREQHITGMVGIPVQVLALARRAAQLNLTFPALRNVLLSTDHVSGAVLAAIETAWGCTVYNHYGMTETGLGGGVDCRARRGYHLREADLCYEIIDPAQGTPVPDGVYGEVVVTTLTREGMPLIRYRTGDRGRFLPGACPCGSSLRTLEHIRCRLSSIISIDEAHSFSMADLDAAIFPVDGVVNFSAAWAESARVLGITLYLLDKAPPDTVERVAAAVSALPPLSATSAAVHVRTRPHHAAPVETGTGKRMIRRV